MGINYTDIATTDPIIAATINDRLDELDTAIATGGIGATLTNRSGGALAANDCVVVDTANDESVTTTTTQGDDNAPQIVIQGGADLATVTTVSVGEVTVVVDGVASRGDFIQTSTTVKRVNPTATLTSGCFGILLEAAAGAGSTAKALLFGLIISPDLAASKITSGQLLLERGGTEADLSATGPGFLKQASGGAAVTVAALAAGDMPSSIDAANISAGSVSNTEFDYLNGVTSAIQTQIDGKSSTSHNDTHKTGGSDAFVVTDLLDAVARIQIKESGTTAGTRRGINLIPGSNISFELTDQSGDEHVDIEINAAGGSLGTDELVKVGAGGTADYMNSTDFEQDATNHVRINRTNAHPILITAKGFIATLSADQTGIVDSTDTKITFNQEDFDSEADYDPTTNYRHTPSLAGKWLYIAQLRFNSAAAAVYQAKIEKNAAAVATGQNGGGSGGTASVVLAVAVVDMNGTTDYVEIFGRHTTGANRDITSGVQTYFQGFFLGE